MSLNYPSLIFEYHWAEPVISVDNFSGTICHYRLFFTAFSAEDVIGKDAGR